MKEYDFKRLEKQLAPDDNLVQSLFDRIEDLEAHPEKKDAFLEQDNFDKPVRNNSYVLILSAAAAFLIVFGAAVYFNSRPERLKTDNDNFSDTEISVMSSEVENTLSESTDVPESTEIAESTASEGSSKPSEHSDTHAEKAGSANPNLNVTDITKGEHGYERNEWFPEPVADEYNEYTDNGQAAALAIPVSEYRSFDFNGITYHYALSNDDEIFDYYGKSIPNDSYIGEQIAEVEVSSFYDSIRPNETAEVYEMKFADSHDIVAVKFPYFNRDQRYYLFSNTEYVCEDYSDMIRSLNIDKYTFNGQSVNEYNGSVMYIDDDYELLQLFISADGKLTDGVSGEKLWKTYLDIPVYGSSISFSCYSGGQIMIYAFGNELYYDVGTDTTSEITSYINDNCHE